MISPFFLEIQVPRVVVPDSEFPASNSPGILDTKLAMVDFPTPAFPKNILAVSKPSHDPSMIPLLSSSISE